MNKQELLDKYLGGNLSEEETIVFNKLNESDPEFHKKVAFHDDLSIVVLEDERIRLKSILSIRKLEKAKSKKNNRRIILISFGIILILASIIIYLLANNLKSPEAIYAANFEPYPNSYRPVARNALNNAETQGFTAYEKGNYLLAAEKFEESLTEKQDLSILFYQGVSYSAIGNFSMAIQNMEKVKGKDFPYAAESYWYLGLYYLKQGSYEEAISNFTEFIDRSEDKEKKQNASEIIEWIKSSKSNK